MSQNRMSMRQPQCVNTDGRVGSHTFTFSLPPRIADPPTIHIAKPLDASENGAPSQWLQMGDTLS